MAYSDRDDLNYLGQLYLVGAYQTPFLNMIGGLQGGAKTVNGFTVPIAQPWSLDAAAQTTQSEATAAAAGTANTYTRAQDKNYIQIMKYDYASTFAKQSTAGEISGVALAGRAQPVTNEKAFQRDAAFRQLALDIDFSMLNGVGVAPASSATNSKMDGLLTAISTNTVAGGAATLTKAMINNLMKEMATNGAQFNNMVMLCGAHNKQVVTSLYEYAPESRTVGGTSIDTLELDFAKMGVVYAPNMPADEIYVVDLAVCFPTFCPYNGSVISDIELSKTAAKDGGFWYSQVSLDYGPEEYHGSITGLATS